MTATEWAERLDGFARYARAPRVSGGDPLVYELTAEEAAALATLLRAMVDELGAVWRWANVSNDQSDEVRWRAIEEQTAATLRRRQAEGRE